MPSDNPTAYVYQIQQGNATFLNATDITDADRERAKALRKNWLEAAAKQNTWTLVNDGWIHAAAYERMMCESANEVARLKHAAEADKATIAQLRARLAELDGKR